MASAVVLDLLLTEFNTRSERDKSTNTCIAAAKPMFSADFFIKNVKYLVVSYHFIYLDHMCQRAPSDLLLVKLYTSQIF